MSQVTRYANRVLKGLRSILSASGLHPLPIFRSLRGYNRSDLQADTRSGVNVALLAFPQGMAYAVIAGLPIEYGIYGSVIASMIGPVFSGSRFIVLGPTNATSVLLPVAIGTMAVTVDEKVALVPVLIILSGLFLLIGGLFRVANLTQYISRAVVAGYITAAAIYIIVKQVGKVLYTDFSTPLDATLFDIITRTVASFEFMHWPSLVIGLITTVIFLLLKRFVPTLPNVAVTLILVSVLTAAVDSMPDHFDFFQDGASNPILLFGAVNASDWHLTPPAISFETISKLAEPALIIAFLCILEGSSIGKSLAARSGEKLDANQEMYSMGMANICCALGQGMPASGSLTRSKLNADSGAHSPVSSVICGLLCLLGVILLGPLISTIPVAALAMVVIFIGFSLFNAHTIRLVTRSTHSDAAVFAVTFLTALFIRLDFAIVFGAILSIILFLRKVSAPELVEYSFNEQGHLYEIDSVDSRSNPHVSIVHVEGELFFGAAELFRDQMRRVCDDPNLKIIILRLKNAYHLDATSIMALEELIRYLRENDRDLIVSGARKEVYRVFKRSRLIDLLGPENFFMGAPSNPNVSTRNALKRAKQIIGEGDVDVKIYYDPSKSG